MPAIPEDFPLWPVENLQRTIRPDEIHVWAWPLETPADDSLPGVELLDEQELERLRRFHFTPDRQRFAVAHATLRRILGAYLGKLPQEVRFRANDFGKPALFDTSSQLTFNLSHSRTVGLAAVGYGAPLGVDVEDVRPIEPGVAEHYFSAPELSELSKLTGDAWLSGFYRCWTRKEAILKAEGIGLHLALDSFDVGLSAEAELRATRHRFSHAWKLHNLAPWPGVAGALATASPEAKVSCFRVPEFEKAH
jgi:4'-phosphopantetheinyl transferase